MINGPSPDKSSRDLSISRGKVLIGVKQLPRLVTVSHVLVGFEVVGAPGGVGRDAARFRRSLWTNLIMSQKAGTIKTSHGIIATIKVISDATLSARTDPDSRKASPIGVKKLTPRTDSSTWNAISTDTFSVSFARVLRCAVSLSNCD